MKILKNIILTFLLLGSVASSFGQTVFGGGGTKMGATNCYACVSVLSSNNGTPLVTYINATSDLASSSITFYSVTNVADITAASFGNTNYVTSTNNFGVAGQIVLLRHFATDTYEKLQVSSVTQTNQLLGAWTSTVAAAAGDRIYALTPAGTIPVGAATVSVVGSGVYAGQKGYPLYCEISGTSSCNLNAITATYQ